MFATRLGTTYLLLTLSLQGCAFAPMSSASRSSETQRLTPTGALDFSWKLSGDRSVAPLQVFSDATHTWLQWQPGQALPAIFGIAGVGDDGGGEQLASYDRAGPYTRLEGHWVAFVFRGAHHQARARRVMPPPASPVSESKIVEPISAPVSNSSTLGTVPSGNASQPFYAITTADKNLRQALSRWTGLSGWRFQAEHWAVDVDIPLTATASFTDDFIVSVRALLESTELSERPLQPCFYENQVLRVVPITENCDRTSVEGTRI